jgi:hypothetical protein
VVESGRKGDLKERIYGTEKQERREPISIDGMKNRLMLHPNYHRQVHRRKLKFL